MKILQLNAWGGRLGNQIIELLQREDADIVCLQEAIEVPGGRSFLFSDLEEIKEGSHYPYCFFTPQFGYRLMKRHARSGLAILSKNPFIETDAIFTRLEYLDDFDLVDTDYNIRSLQHVVIEQNGRNMHIVNHHGHHLRAHKNGDDETLRQCQMIVEYIKKLHGEIILCGDFNLTPESESLQLINEILVNHVKEHAVPTTRTVLTHKKESCDYIFTSPSLEVKKFAVFDDIVSDHKALLIEI